MAETVFFVICYLVVAGFILAAGFYIFIMPMFLALSFIYGMVEEAVTSTRWWELYQIDRRAEAAARKMEADHYQVMEEIDRLVREHRRTNP